MCYRGCLALHGTVGRDLLKQSDPGRSIPPLAPSRLFIPPLLTRISCVPSHPAGAASRARFDYTSWEGTRQLTAALLHRDFGVAWWLPRGQLVPPVANRLNYLLWLHDLLQLSPPPGAGSGGGAAAMGPSVHGLDIGCGASFIYPLLGAAQFGWSMTGSDVTDVAVAAASSLIDANPRLRHLLRVVRAKQVDLSSEVPRPDAGKSAGAGGGILTAALDAGAAAAAYDNGSSAVASEACAGGFPLFAFTMCNPPFFSSLDEASGNPNTACGGTADEMVWPGRRGGGDLHTHEPSCTCSLPACAH